MDFTLDLQQPIEQTVGYRDLVPRWVAGLALDTASSPGEPVRRPYSYLGECECPNDCPRDHENE